jgi:hypothetical protein
MAAQPLGRLEAAGWADVLGALSSQFASHDVITLGEAHARDVDLQLRLRLILHAQLPRDVRLIVAEFADERLTKAVAEANRRRVGAAPLRVVVEAPQRAVQVVVDSVRRGERAIVVYGAGHLWKQEGGLTTALQAAGARVLVVQTLAPPTPAAVLARFAASTNLTERPLLSSLHDAAVGQTAAADIFPGEPIAPSLRLADLADVAILFGGDRASAPSVSATPLKPPSASSTVVLTGRLTGLFPRPESRHVYLVLSVDTGTGSTERWIVQGESTKQLTDWGWRFDAPQSVRLGEQLRVEALVPSARTNDKRIAVDAPPQVVAALKLGQPVVYGIEVTLPDGRAMQMGFKRR